MTSWKSWMTWAALGLVFIVAPAIAYFVTREQGPPGLKYVEVHVPRYWRISTDMTPVRTELYHYEERNWAQPEPLVFEFPRAAYAYEENQEGGPQADITLLVDRETFDLLVPTIMREHDVSSADQVAGIYRPAYIGRNLLIRVRSNAILGSRISRSLFDGREYTLEAEACGFHLGYRDVFHVPGSPQIVDGFDFNRGPVEGYSIDPESRSLSVNCSAGSDTCGVSLRFRGRDVSYRLVSEEICRHSEYSDRVAQFLERHAQ